MFLYTTLTIARIFSKPLGINKANLTIHSIDFFQDFSMLYEYLFLFHYWSPMVCKDDEGRIK